MNSSYVLGIVGRDSFIKGRWYGPNELKKEMVERLANSFLHTYKVRSETSRRVYTVKIKNNGEEVSGYSCTCPQFERAKTCKHIAAVLIRDYDKIATFEYIDKLALSKEILANFKNNNIATIKEKLDTEIEFAFEYDSIYLKIKIGDKKKYNLSPYNKCLSFIEAYMENKEFTFGKSLTYDPNKHYFDNKDKELLEYLSTIIGHYNGYYRSTRYVTINNKEFQTILNIIGDKEFSITGSGIIYNIYKGLPTEYNLSKDNDGNFILKIDDVENYVFLDHDYKYAVYNHNFYMLAAKDRDLLKQLRMRKISELVFDKDSISQFNNGLLNNVKDNLTIDSEVTEIELPTKPKVKLYFDISYSKLKCDIILDYKGRELNYFDKADFSRDIDYEKEVVTDILNYNFVEDNNSFIMTDDDDIYYFLDEVITTLKDKYEIFTSKRIDNTKVLKNISTSSNFSIGQDGIMSYKFNVDGIKNEDLNSLFSALKQKKKYYKLKNNNVVSLENNEELEQLNNLISDLDLSKNDILEGDAIVPKYRAIYIDSLKNSKYKNIETNNLFDEFISNFKKYKNASVSFDEEDKEVLRDYQKDGVKWLNTIYKCDLGGILADEMGLGKSLQTITFIKQILKEKPLAKIIIVVPTALVYNWEKEFAKFAPQLKYVAVSDTVAKRQEIFANKDKYNIFITSYGLIRNDKDEYEDMNFELCVVDEAQNIKNYQATMTREIKKIKAKCKIALTGTPVENNVTELWSIFDFIMPGYLNSVVKFREKYNIKDVDEKGLEVLNNLSNQIKPFILRRKKSDVVKSLPKKIENKIYIDLPDKQKMLYMKVLKDTKKEMDEMIRDGGFEKSRMKILQLLMKLRQICIDPSVMYENYTGDRIKIDELLRVVKESIDNNHKILIFSSFKRVLDNVKELFAKNNITYYMIDGSVKSKDRMNMVEKFNNDDTNCFLITLKSGGTGLNLTGADTVIHLDIWWNPQVENQATDRAHRIGQTKTVSVIKLVTKGTIEERIIELQDKKKILSENLIEGKSDSESLSSLSEKDIKKLLSSGE